MTDNNEKFYKVTIPLYPDKVKVSEKARPKYYKRDEVDKLPKKYRDKFYFKDDYIIETETGLPIIKNTLSAGKPRYESVNFQKLWNGAIARHLRSKVADLLHTFYSDAIKGKLPDKINLEEDEALMLCYEFHNVTSGLTMDLDNHAHWHIKTSLDVLSKRAVPNQEKHNYKLGIIEDDGLKFVRGILYTFTECETSEDRKLVITLIKVKKRKGDAFDFLLSPLIDA